MMKPNTAVRRGDTSSAPQNPMIRRQHEGDVAAQGEEIAVGEIDDVGEVEDQRQAQRHQHVEGADDQPVGDVEQDELQHRPPFGGRSSGRRRQAGWIILQPVSATGPAAFSPGTTMVDGEHVVRVAFRRMHVADEDVGHQLVVAGAVEDLAGLQRDVGRQVPCLPSPAPAWARPATWPFRPPAGPTATAT